MLKLSSLLDLVPLRLVLMDNPAEHEGVSEGNCNVGYCKRI
jgi:hypothetical protein